jgi:hypothetical protein
MKPMHGGGCWNRVTINLLSDNSENPCLSLIKAADSQTAAYPRLSLRSKHQLSAELPLENETDDKLTCNVLTCLHLELDSACGMMRSRF